MLITKICYESSASCHCLLLTVIESERRKIIVQLTRKTLKEQREKPKKVRRVNKKKQQERAISVVSESLALSALSRFFSAALRFHSFINPMFFTWINSTQFEGEENKNKNSRKINNCWRSRKKFLKFFVSHLHSCMFISLLLCQLKERKAIYLTITLPWKRKDARNDEMINFDEIRNRREARQGWRNVSRMLWVVCLNY